MSVYLKVKCTYMGLYECQCVRLLSLCGCDNISLAVCASVGLCERLGVCLIMSACLCVIVCM